MEDLVVCRSTERERRWPSEPCTNGLASVVEVEVRIGTKWVVFPIAPDTMGCSLDRKGGQIDAAIPCFVGGGPVSLTVVFTEKGGAARITRCTLGGQDLLEQDLFSKPAPVGTVFQRLDDELGVSGPVLAGRLFARLVLLRSDPDRRRHTVLLQADTNLDHRLAPFAIEKPIDAEGPARLVQIPDLWLTSPQAPFPPSRRWYVAFMDLGFAAGREVWNGFLDELVRASLLDRRNGALFAPSLSTAGNQPGQDLRWDYMVAVDERAGTVRDAQSHALRLRGANMTPAVRLGFPLVRDESGADVEAAFPLRQLRAGEVLSDDQLAELGVAAENPGLALPQREGTTVHALAGPARVRLGSLDLELSGRPRLHLDATRPELRWELVPSDLGDKFTWRQSSLEMFWAVDKAIPGGQDDLGEEVYTQCGALPGTLPDLVVDPDRPPPTDHDLECTMQRERPLVVPLDAPANSALLLHVAERARPGDARRIDLELRKLADGVQAAGGAPKSGDELIDVCGDDRGLQRAVVLDREPFLVAQVSFPAIGSLVDTSAGNEVANWRNYGLDAGAWRIRFADAEPFCLALPPQAVGETMEKEGNFAPGTLADFRLSPPALLAMRERYYKQSFPEAPWNLRRLLADPARELPGAQLEHLQYEVLYGLSCRIDHPFLRLAETTALVGWVQGALPAQPAWRPLLDRPANGGDPVSRSYLKARAAWAKTYRAVHQRLALLEVWDLSRLAAIDLAEGVTCWIRQPPPNDPLAIHQAPRELVRVREADLANPLAPEAGKLQGGVTWGFESRNVFHAVMNGGPPNRWPRSSGAEATDLGFSALGGFGHQMAAFDHWRTKVFADVAMGRTYTYTLERIGRIGVWWNRAKHVIVYERSVAPSEQFAGTQNGHHGRAVTRKVAEYVEILENERTYPDRGRGDGRATGFVTHCSFSDDPAQVVRFRVLGRAWGGDVGSVGWKVPLWRPAKSGDPVVDERYDRLYPKPVVALRVLASDDGESVPRKVVIADPGNLVFYTDTTAPPQAAGDPGFDLSNTDLWAPVEGVDFVDASRPRPRRDPAFDLGSLQQTGPGDALLPAGHRPCTFLIEPDENRVDLVANRQANPMGSLLSSVTLCRSMAEQAASFGGEYQSVAAAVQKKVDSWIARLPVSGKIPQGFDPATLPDLLCAEVKSAAADADTWLETQRLQARARFGEAAEVAAEQALARVDASLEALIGEAERSALGAALTHLLGGLKWTSEEERQARIKQLRVDLPREVDAAAERLSVLLPSPAPLTDAMANALRHVGQEVARAMATAATLRTLATGTVDGLFEDERLLDLAEAYLQRFDDFVDQLSRLEETASRLELEVDKAQRSVTFSAAAVRVLARVRERIEQLSSETLPAALAAAREAAGLLRGYQQRLGEMVPAVKARVHDLLRRGTAWVDHGKALVGELDKLAGDLEAVQGIVTGAMTRWRQDLTNELLSQVEAVVAQAQNKDLERIPDEWVGPLRRLKDSLKVALRDKVKQGIEAALAQGNWGPDPPPLPKVAASTDELCNDFRARYQQLLAAVAGDAAAVRQALAAARDSVVGELDRAFGPEVRQLRTMLGEVEAKGDDLLKLVRAFGKPPEISGLEFDRPEVAFFYDAASEVVDLTPVISRAAQVSAVADALKPFGVDLPVEKLGAELLPASLPKFDLASILPNVAGIPLTNLFSGVKMPAIPNVKVRHGLDPQTRRAWVQADVDVEIAKTATMFALGPLAVRINQPRFTAQVRMEADLHGVQQRRVRGRLAGDWRLEVGSFELITFTQTPLEFDESGRVEFDIQPRNVKLAPAMDFINQLLSSLSPGGLCIRIDGTGVVCSLDLPIPDTQLGAFGFAGLRLGAALALRYGGGFRIGITAYLGRRDAPFTLTIFVLGGAGYIELGSEYTPATGKVEAIADLAIAVSASLAIALGPIRGGVAVYVGVTASYHSGRGGGLAVGLMFMVRGHVSVLAIASATVVLRLDGQYDQGAFVGRGSLDISIKICWCFTLEVHESVTYTLGKVGSAGAALPPSRRPRSFGRLAQLGGALALGAEDQALDDLEAGVRDFVDMLI